MPTTYLITAQSQYLPPPFLPPDGKVVHGRKLCDILLLLPQTNATRWLWKCFIPASFRSGNIKLAEYNI